jgi:hypothetical protein
MTWVRLDDDGKNGIHEWVPKEIVEEAEKQAKKELEGGDEEDEKMQES